MKHRDYESSDSFDIDDSGMEMDENEQKENLQINDHESGYSKDRESAADEWTESDSADVEEYESEHDTESKPKAAFKIINESSGLTPNPGPGFMRLYYVYTHCRSIVYCSCLINLYRFRKKRGSIS